MGVARLLKNAGFNPDGVGVAAAPRLGTYGDAIVEVMGGLQNWGFADEGSAFVNMNPTISTGVKLQGDTTTAWVATTPSILIVNIDAAGGKNIIMDGIKLLVTVAGAGLASLHLAVLLDTANRYSTAGTDISANTFNANSGVGVASIAKLYYGATATAASAAVRKVGRDVLRAAIPVVNDTYEIAFGNHYSTSVGVDGGTGITKAGKSMPAIIVAPGHSLLIYLWAGSMSTSPSMEYEISWAER